MMKNVLAAVLIAVVSAAAPAADGPLKFRVEIKSTNQAGVTTVVVDDRLSTGPGLQAQSGRSDEAGGHDFVNIAPIAAAAGDAATAPRKVEVAWDHAKVRKDGKRVGAPVVQSSDVRASTWIRPGDTLLVGAVQDEDGNETSALYLTLLKE